MIITKSKKFKCTLLSLLMILGVTFSSIAATYTTVNNIRYSVTTSKKTAVVYKPADGLYSGTIEIPPTITYNNEEYSVIGVSGAAFKGATELISVKLPESCVTIGASAFNGCTSLTTFPCVEGTTSIGAKAFQGCSSLTEAFLPTNCVGPYAGQEFEGCASLKKFSFRDNNAVLNLMPNFFGMPDPGAANQGFTPCPIEEIYLGRNIGNKYGSCFKGMKSLKSVTCGANVTEFIVSEMFKGCTSLTTFNLDKSTAFTTFCTDCFNGCKSLESITIPVGVTLIPTGFADGCNKLAKVTLSTNITSIGSRAFYGAPLDNSFCIPNTITYIGESAFENGLKSTELAVPNSVTTIKDRAFFGCNINTITLPATATIGSSILALNPLSKIQLSNTESAEALLKTDGFILSSIDDSKIYVCVSNNDNLPKTISNQKVSILDSYSFANCPIENIDIPNLSVIGNHAFLDTKNLKTFTLTKQMNCGTNILEGSGITEFSAGQGVTILPVGLCYNCIKLNKITLSPELNVIMHNAFYGCDAIKDMKLGSYLNYMESGAIPESIETLSCTNVNVPVINEEVFNDNQKNVICKVPESAVEDYRTNGTWNKINLQGDATITGQKTALGCPTGLYFATKDGRLMYQDNNGTILDTSIPAGEHALQLGAAHNRVYVSYAGKKFTYQSPTAGLGDGELFYLNKAGSNFYRVTLVSNIGYEAFQDPFSMSVDAPNKQLLVADRNVGIHVIDTERPGLYGEQPFLVKNNWLGFYGVDISYGAIGCGMIRDNEGVYWMGKKFNGLGIFRFDADQIGSDEKAGTLPPYPVLLKDNTITTFTIDEDNGYLYCYLQFGSAKPGVYRFDLATLKTKGADATFADDGTLIDDSPVLSEGVAPSELTGITQISSNGENVYWAYIAPKSEDDEYIGKTDSKYPTKFDPENSLHKSGIKYISAKGGTPDVKYAVHDYEAYGVAAYVYDPGYSATDKITSDKASNKATVKGSTIDIPMNASVNVFNVNGALLEQKGVTAGDTFTLDNLEKGMYIITINYVDGTNQIIKMVK